MFPPNLALSNRSKQPRCLSPNQFLFSERMNSCNFRTLRKHCYRFEQYRSDEDSSSASPPNSTNGYVQAYVFELLAGNISCLNEIMSVVLLAKCVSFSFGFLSRDIEKKYGQFYFGLLKSLADLICDHFNGKLS